MNEYMEMWCRWVSNPSLLLPGWELVALHAAKFGEQEFIEAMAGMDLEVAEECYRTYFEPEHYDGCCEECDDPSDCEGWRMDDSAEACRVRLYHKPFWSWHNPGGAPGSPASRNPPARDWMTAWVAGMLRANLERHAEADEVGGPGTASDRAASPRQSKLPAPSHPGQLTLLSETG